MARGKYHFNYDTLSFVKIQVSFKEIFYTRILPHLTGALFLGIILFIVATYFFDSPFLKKLKTLNSEYILKYEILNKRIEHASNVLSEMQQRDDNVYRLIFEASVVPSTIRKAGFGGSDKYSYLNGFENSKLLIETARNLDIISKQIVVQSKSYDEVIEMVKDKEKMVASIPAIQPIAIKDLERFGSAFGYRMHPILHYVRMHEGVDLIANTGTKVYATGNGIVTRTEIMGSGFGKNIRISHGYGYMTIYAHLSKILVRSGQRVKRGDLIGLVGSTGLSTSPHLHYEVRINNAPVNPLNFYYNDLTDEEYQKMLESSSKSETHIFENN
jgi:murein DD-endopeptidase MepM/ murein hydrolase activator NlpD